MMRRRVAVAGLGMSALGLAGCVEGMFFHPDDRAPSPPAGLPTPPQDLWFRAADGTKLHAWWLPAAQARATIVHAHGNAQNIGHHLPFVSWLPAAGFHVLTFDYRGFGQSQGEPSLQGVVQDLRAAIAEARRQARGLRLVLLGQSLGGATALRAAAQEQNAGAADIAAVVADSPFASYRGVAQDAAGRGPLGWIAPLALKALPDASQDPLAAVAQLRSPLLLIHGTADRVIAVEHSLRLHEAAREPKALWRIEGGEHIDALLRPDIRSRVAAHLNSLLSTPRAGPVAYPAPPRRFKQSGRAQPA
jgi:uncharacterized protein